MPKRNRPNAGKGISLGQYLRYLNHVITFVTYLKSRTRLAGGIIALLLLALASITVPAFNGDGGSLMAQASEVLDRFVGRSPGERGETDLIKTKVKRAKGKFADKLLATAPRAKAGGPEERALGKIFDTPPEEAVNDLSENPLGPLALGGPGSDALIPLADIASPGGRPGGSGFPGGISTVVPPGTSGTPGNPTDPAGPTDTTNPVDPTPPVAAVPEPATWALMLLGFGLCGAALRRRHQRSGKPGIA